ncbi:MAG TPA: FHA domain-containing protein [Polyangiaceae bacterium]|jgi:ABC-type multidrug transport system ATPase subunit/pSer/pThr/pTyr-binding forkhead associated (FHA) protein|nr:MAG: ABC transporter ATP-binding/permease protein [Deltaproteobacteria bacterium ADurb.Bin207]HNS97687.1 FHA domain-containing protein [Polyangiaceae bacterium]HNZ24766.1 FHA domain-containing protein [Polyangiaceae bacterium]HOD24490.1 FHA domain-containing protein [Polyangiaceae bacterium]HOE50509.1 FHA domain-containing protein [Polyangiaceae bacterium]
MIAGFGKQTIVLGSAADCDIVLAGPGVAPQHARIVHQGAGQLLFVDGGAGPSFAGGQMVPKGGSVPFDLRTPFACGQVAIPLNHPAIALMLMERGSVQAPPGQIIVGRDPARCSLVIRHASVSSRHATVMLDRMVVVDEGSTSGTYLGSGRIASETPTPVDPNGVIAFGPVVVPVATLGQIVQAMAGVQGQPMVSQAVQAAQASFVSQAMQGQAPMVSQQVPAPVSAGHKKNRTVIGNLDFQKPFQTIGRTPDNDIVLSHPQVSSRHAVLVKSGNQVFIEDRGSANGTYVKGQRIAPGVKVPVQHGERIYLGPMPLVIHMPEEGGGQLLIPDVSKWQGRPLYEIEAWELFLEVPDRDNPSTNKVLLDKISFKALPGDMIALMGPSGAGKTTLLLALNGYLPPSSGLVRINGENLYAIYDNLRGSIGYVPQDDIVHPELTVFEAVRYSARFRLPPDYSDEEIDQRVDQTLKELGLEGVRNLQIGKPEKKILSGGQRKRVNIALELVTDPVILFLDEPTSGLAADDTTALINLLADLAKATGKTIIMTIHQPAKDEFERFNLALILGYGGVPMFYGPTSPDAYRFFGSFLETQGKPNTVDNPRDMFDILNQREGPIYQQMLAQNPNTPRGAARQYAAKLWEAEYKASAVYQKMYAPPRAVGTGGGQNYVPPGAPKTKGQLRLLMSRYFTVKWRDRSGTAIMFLQAPIIGVLLALVFGGQKDSIPYWCLGALQELSKRAGQLGSTGDLLSNMQATRDNSAAAFFVVVAAVWFGTSNAAREIVSERAIYLRERMVNLKLFNYVASKYILLCVFCVLQCTMLLGIVFFSLGFHGGIEAFLWELSYLNAVAFMSAALGLLLSTMVTSSEAAQALTPIALIPQVVLGGLMVPMTTNPLLKWPMLIIPARWGFQGLVAHERKAIAKDPAWLIDIGKPDINSAADFVSAGKFECATAQIAGDNFNGAWGFTDYDLFWVPFAVMGGMTFATLIALLIILKHRDPV